MSFVKTIVKLGFLGVLVAAVVASVMATRRANDSLDVAFEEWPDVPTQSRGLTVRPSPQEETCQRWSIVDSAVPASRSASCPSAAG